MLVPSPCLEASDFFVEPPRIEKSLRLNNGPPMMAGIPNHADMDPSASRAHGITTYVLAIYLVGAEISRHPSDGN